MSLDFNEIRDIFLGTNGIDVGQITDFINEMRVARNSSYYNQERRRKFLELDLINVYSELNNTSANIRRKNAIEQLLRVAPPVYIEEEQIFV